MTSMEWLYILGLILGGVTAIIVAQRGAIEALVGKRLDEIQASVAGHTTTLTEHGNALTRHETVLEINGLLDRRKEPR